MKDIKYKVFIDGEKELFDVTLLNLQDKKLEINKVGKCEFSFIEVSLLEYTGVKDDSGEEIYGGHIVWVNNYLIETFTPYQARVIWKNGQYLLENISNEKDVNVLFPFPNTFGTMGLSYKIISHELLQQ